MLKFAAPVALVAFAFALEGAFLLQVMVGAPERREPRELGTEWARGPGLRRGGEAPAPCTEGEGRAVSHPSADGGSKPVALCAPGVEDPPLGPCREARLPSPKSPESRDAGVRPGCEADLSIGAGIARGCG